MKFPCGKNEQEPFPDRLGRLAFGTIKLACRETAKLLRHDARVSPEGPEYQTAPGPESGRH
jgi:hypothetical protein